MAPSGDPYVTVEKNATAVPPDGDFQLRVTVQVDAADLVPGSRAFRSHRPAGRLLYQKTQVRNDVETGTVTFEYDRALADLEVEPGAYPIEIRVRSDSGEVREWIVDDDLLVYDPDRAAYSPAAARPLRLFARVRCGGPLRSRSIRRPPARATRSARWLRTPLRTPTPRWACSWHPRCSRSGDGSPRAMSTSAPKASRRSVPSPTQRRTMRTSLSLLGTALDSGRLELLDVPYSNPDIIGLQESRATR